MKLSLWTILPAILVPATAQLQDLDEAAGKSRALSDVSAAFGVLEQAGDCGEVYNDRDGQLIIGSSVTTTITHTDATTDESTLKTATIFTFCEPIPAGTTVTCTLSDCNVPDGTFSAFGSVMGEMDNDTCEGEEGPEASECPYSQSYVMKEDTTQGYVVFVHSNTNCQAATGKITCIADNNFAPTITDTNACRDPFSTATDCWGNPAWSFLKSFWS